MTGVSGLVQLVRYRYRGQICLTAFGLTLTLAIKARGYSRS